MNKSGTLRWVRTPGRLQFWVEISGHPTAIEGRGGLEVSTSYGRGSVARLLGLLDDGLVEIEEPLRISVPDAQVAAFDALELRRLGLPQAAPFRLEIRGVGILSSPRFRFQHRLVTTEGRPVLGATRDGVLLAAARTDYLLLDPLYSLIEGMEAFNATPPENLDERFLRWAELKALLPEDALIDQHLRSMNIVRADAFTLDASDDQLILPVPLSRTRASDEPPWQDEDLYAESLPADPLRSFSDRFSLLPGGQARYALDGSWYVVLGETLKQALSIVHEYQKRPLDEQRSFLANPQTALKERLGNRIDENELDALFQETPTYLSARVLRLGEWHPKTCAFVIPARQSWLPPEEMLLGVPVGNAIYEVAVGDAPAVASSIRKAMASGNAEIVFNSQHIPATAESLAAFERLTGPTRQRADEPPLSEQPIPNLVPIIIDNLEEVGYSIQPRDTRGEIGGIPAVLRKTNLLKHQVQGLRWLQSHWASGSPGALLADDMGLGKTLQTLGFLAWLQEQIQAGFQSRKPLLIVAPTGLLKNWEDEVQKHLAAPRLGTLARAYGVDLRTLVSKTHREQIQDLIAADWVVTTYETLRDRIRIFVGVDWAAVAFDEVQKLKNPAARMTEMAKSIQADFTVALTGTPVENRLADLWSIVDATNPGFLGSLKEFHETFERPAIEHVEAAAPLAARLTANGETPVMLRRLKEDHLKGLPEKREVFIEESMSPPQAAAYNAIVAEATHATDSRGKMLRVLHALRRTSLLAEALDVEGLSEATVQASARLRAMLRVLDEIKARGEKVLIFAEYLDIQEALIPYLQRHYSLERPPLRISGKVGGARRKQRVDEFQARPAGEFDVMLLSPKAGGVGLTLTAANHVIHLTRWWNPAVEDQCTDRVYRIGQTKTVHVHYPMAIHPRFGEHSFDKNLNELLSTKRRLSREVLAPPTAGTAEISGLFESSVGPADAL